MAKTVISAPRKPARPALKEAPKQANEPTLQMDAEAAPSAPPTPESSAAQPDQRAADLAALQAMEARLADGLAGVHEKQAEHNAALGQIAEALSPLPGRIADAERRLVALQQEQSMLPRRINAARALLIGAATTQAEGQARAELDALQTREQTLPPDLAHAEAALAETQTACEAERALLEAEAAEHRAARGDLAGLAEALQEQANQARRKLAEAVYASIEAEQQTHQAELDAAEKATEQARTALLALAEDAKARLQQTAPDLLVQFQAAHVPVRDRLTERLELVLAYRRALLSWQQQGIWGGDFPYYWLIFNEAERGYPNIQQQTIHEIEQALAKHVAQQQRIR